MQTRIFSNTFHILICQERRVVDSRDQDCPRKHFDPILGQRLVFADVMLLCKAKR